MYFLVLVKQPFISFEDIKKIPENVYQCIPPQSKPRAIIRIDKQFKDLIKQLNSKQLREIKEQLFTINLIADWDGLDSVTNLPVIPKWSKMGQNVAVLRGKNFLRKRV